MFTHRLDDLEEVVATFHHLAALGAAGPARSVEEHDITQEEVEIPVPRHTKHPKDGECEVNFFRLFPSGQSARFCENFSFVGKGVLEIVTVLDTRLIRYP
jgi:hypothetical protein